MHALYAALILLLLATPAPAQTYGGTRFRVFDWNSLAAIHPDYNTVEISGCPTPSITKAQLASGGYIAWIGDFSDVGTGITTTIQRYCTDTIRGSGTNLSTHANNKILMDGVLALQSGVSKVRWYWVVRLNLMAAPQIQSWWQPSYALASSDSLTTAKAWFSGDGTADCTGTPCSLTETWYSENLSTAITARGGSPDTMLYYAAVTGVGMKSHILTSVMMDGSNAAYRAARITNEVVPAIAQAGYEGVVVVHKLYQVTGWRVGVGNAPYRYATAAANVTALNARADTFWTGNPPTDRRYREYVTALRDWGVDLRAAGIPYLVTIACDNIKLFSPYGGGAPYTAWDDAGTAEDERQIIRQWVFNARTVMLETATWSCIDAAELTAAIADIRANGPEVVLYNEAAGYTNYHLVP